MVAGINADDAAGAYEALAADLRRCADDKRKGIARLLALESDDPVRELVVEAEPVG